jgi:rhodanese-related sulfurtransferase
MRALRQSLLLLGISVAAAAVSWAVRGDRLPLLADPEVYALDLSVPLVSVAEARDHFEAGSHYFVDTRAGDPTGRAVIPGSFTIRELELAADLEAVMDFLYPEDPLVLYGADLPLPVDAVAARLADLGYENLVILQGGIAAWREAGGPLSGEEAAP